MAGVAVGIVALLGVTGAPGDPLPAALSGALSPGATDAAAAREPALPPDQAVREGVVAPEGPAPSESLTPADLAPAVGPAPPPAAAAPSAAAAPPVPAPARATGASHPPVVVLNNSRRPGLADRASARFARNGWPIALTGNFRGRLRATTVYFEAGQRPAARRLASTFRGIDRVLPRAGNIPGPRGLVVVLTRDYPA